MSRQTSPSELRAASTSVGTSSMASSGGSTRLMGVRIGSSVCRSPMASQPALPCWRRPRVSRRKCGHCMPTDPARVPTARPRWGRGPSPTPTHPHLLRRTNRQTQWGGLNAGNGMFNPATAIFVVGTGVTAPDKPPTPLNCTKEPPKFVTHRSPLLSNTKPLGNSRLPAFALIVTSGAGLPDTAN